MEFFVDPKTELWKTNKPPAVRMVEVASAYSIKPHYIVKSFFLENQDFFSVSSINISEEGAIEMDISLYLVRK